LGRILLLPVVGVNPFLCPLHQLLIKHTNPAQFGELSDYRAFGARGSAHQLFA